MTRSTALWRQHLPDAPASCSSAGQLEVRNSYDALSAESVSWLQPWRGTANVTDCVPVDAADRAYVSWTSDSRPQEKRDSDSHRGTRVQPAVV